MATATEAQKSAIYFYCGWPQRFVQVNTALENAITNISVIDAQWARIVNPATGDPPGRLALLEAQHALLLSAQRRLKVSKAGSVELNPMEITMLRSVGRQLVLELCSMLGVERGKDVFSENGGGNMGAAGYGIQPLGPAMSGNYIGK